MDLLFRAVFKINATSYKIMNKKPLLSICIPTYNRKKYLQETLDSIFSQDWFNEENIEIVISDNASTDGTRDFIQRYLFEHKNIYYHRNEENIGADRNVLQAIQMGNGMYIWWITDDDIILPWGLWEVLWVILNPIYQDAYIIQMNLWLITQEGDKILWQEKIIPVPDITKKFKSLKCLYEYYKYIYIGITFFSIQVYKNEVFDNPTSIPVTWFPHSCVAALAYNKPSIFIGKSLIGRRCDNSDFWRTDDSIRNVIKFANIFIIWHYKFIKFILINKVDISVFQLVKIEIKNVIMATYLLAKFLFKKITRL